jgi:hypothetical protein
MLSGEFRTKLIKAVREHGLVIVRQRVFVGEGEPSPDEWVAEMDRKYRADAQESFHREAIELATEQNWAARFDDGQGTVTFSLPQKQDA